MFLLVFVALLAFPALGRAGEKGTAASIDEIVSCKASPAQPAAGTDQTLPAADVFNPEPIYVCFAGWCSNDAQCEEWVGPGSTCNRSQGAGCGLCD
jgi:hypothetical protein